ncbi:hypothetical protein RHMOL_Rhmol13G0189800 [Rhododendron molle]|uniref:Uncharacterized protein n=1 Tax=Rhododendron molle TaxID=49168 RepID=A0ACC0L9R9_RHOML|nr:hypothetical protein RHMOL_Rhmol13G0189800 [Rhododendron molle]
MKANICSVKYNPGSSIHVAVGSADHNIHYYDLRNVSQPQHVFSGHKKAVSYVNFLSNNELASVSFSYRVYKKLSSYYSSPINFYLRVIIQEIVMHINILVGVGVMSVSGGEGGMCYPGMYAL